jgi:fatty-acyl-CoA synthase
MTTTGNLIKSTNKTRSKTSARHGANQTHEQGATRIDSVIPTPTLNNLPLRPGDFTNLVEALEYAAKGRTGCNFYSGRGELYAALPYSELRNEARKLASRLHGLGLPRGSKVALVAETHPDFLRFFFACQYTGLVPVPLPLSINMGNRQAYVESLRTLLTDCKAKLAWAPSGILPHLEEAAEGLGLSFIGDSAAFAALSRQPVELQPPEPTDLAYLQYTSGSTRFPRGVMITHQAVMSNLSGIIQHGVDIRPGDRCVSWLPFYHDMGLVGLVLASMASQLSVDYLDTRAFAMRPRLWLALMTRNRATISFGPPFGYELCARRVRTDDLDKFDLSAWRVAGVGAEMIRPEPLRAFAHKLAPSGFDKKAFLACYGMAECSLAASFSPLNLGLRLDSIDKDLHALHQRAVPIESSADRQLADKISAYAVCGRPLPEHEIEIRDDLGNVLPQRYSGTIFVKGPSVMSGYFNNHEATQDALTPEGWLNTGDIGYWAGQDLVITGRKKDLIIINGRNIWPQDLEAIAEQQPEVRSGDALAFSAPDPYGRETAVLVIQCRISHRKNRADLVHRVQHLIREALAIDCFVELVPPHTLPRTSSGKLSRYRARLDFMEQEERRPDVAALA